MEEQNSTSEKRTFLESEDILVFYLTTLLDTTKWIPVEVKSETEDGGNKRKFERNNTLWRECYKTDCHLFVVLRTFQLPANIKTNS